MKDRETSLLVVMIISLVGWMIMNYVSLFNPGLTSISDMFGGATLACAFIEILSMRVNTDD